MIQLKKKNRKKITGAEATEVPRAPSYDKIWLDIKYLFCEMRLLKSANWKSSQY